MSKRAEEAAVAFHNQALLKAKEYAELHGRSIFEEVSYGRGLKSGFIQGYEQAEKDLALTWEDVAKIITIYEAGIDNGDYRRYNGAEWMKEYSQDILKRFNEQRKK